MTQPYDRRLPPTLRGVFVSLQKGFVYFIQGVDGGPIKIGFTASRVRHRLAELQRGSPVLLRVLATIDGSNHLERDLHLQFSRTRLHNEWFEPTSELLDYIRLAGTAVPQ